MYKNVYIEHETVFEVTCSFNSALNDLNTNIDIGINLAE